MSLLHPVHAASALRAQPSLARRRGSARCRLGLESLEDRVMLSQTTAMPAHPIISAHVSAQSSRASQQLNVPIRVTAFDITSVTQNSTNGALSVSGTLTGTILGQTFTTAVNGVLTPAHNSRGTPSLALILQPIHLSLQGLNVDTSGMAIVISAAQRRGQLASVLSTGLNGVMASAGTNSTQAAAQLSALLNNAQVQNAIDQTFARAQVRLVSATPAVGSSGPMISLAINPVRENTQGASLALASSSRGPISVTISEAAGGGMLGNLLNGITSTRRTTLVQQISTALRQISTTVVPVTPATLPGLINATSPPATSTGLTDPTVLTLTLNPIDLNLLGLEVKLYGQDVTSPVTVTVSATAGSGQLLGNLLSVVSGLLNTQGVSTALDNVLNSVVTLLDQGTLSVNGQTATTPTSTTTPVLDAFIAPVHLDLLGAVVDTSPIHLQILAHAGSGLLLGNIVTDLANLLNNPTGNLVNDIESGLTNLLAELNTLFPTITAAATPHASTAQTTGSFQILSLTVPPIDLNLLGLILQTSTIQVNATSQSGNGQLLGNLLFDLFSTAHVSQTDLNTINADLNGVLAKLVGILNASTLSLSAGSVLGLSPILQELTSPTLINTSGTTVPPEPVLNLNIATNDGSPPVDVNLLGVVVTTSNVQVQLLAQPGNGEILGNLVYNVSHLLDGGLLSVLNILGALGV